MTKVVSASGPLEMNPSKAQRVCHNGHGAKTHCSRRDHRAQEKSEERVEYARRDRYAQSIVYESKEQILLDVFHGGPAQSSRRARSREGHL